MGSWVLVCECRTTESVIAANRAVDVLQTQRINFGAEISMISSANFFLIDRKCLKNKRWTTVTRCKPGRRWTRWLEVLWGMWMRSESVPAHRTQMMKIRCREWICPKPSSAEEAESEVSSSGGSRGPRSDTYAHAAQTLLKNETCRAVQVCGKEAGTLQQWGLLIGTDHLLLKLIPGIAQ